MENETSGFTLLPFSITSSFTSLYFALFFFIYVFGVFTNSMIIILICSSDHLHIPMYLFICNLSIVDICFTTVTVPKLLYMLISKDNTVSYRDCFIQMYFHLLNGSAEDMLMLTMAFDRYVAICQPLHYHRVLSKSNCILLVAGVWIVGGFNSFIITMAASNITFCQSKVIHQFFCDGKALIYIACAGLKEFYAVIYLAAFLFGLCPFCVSLTSYIQIIKVILQMKSKEGRRKAFATCSSHLTVIIMYYTTAVSVYVMPKYSIILEEICSVLYTTITPMINPLIYSLRNNDVIKALRKVF